MEYAAIAILAFLAGAAVGGIAAYRFFMLGFRGCLEDGSLKAIPRKDRAIGINETKRSRDALA